MKPSPRVHLLSDGKHTFVKKCIHEYSSTINGLNHKTKDNIVHEYDVYKNLKNNGAKDLMAQCELREINNNGIKTETLVRALSPITLMDFHEAVLWEDLEQMRKIFDSKYFPAGYDKPNLNHVPSWYCKHQCGECRYAISIIGYILMNTYRDTIGFCKLASKHYVFRLTPDNVDFNGVIDFEDYTKGKQDWVDSFYLLKVFENLWSLGLFLPSMPIYTDDELELIIKEDYSPILDASLKNDIKSCLTFNQFTAIFHPKEILELNLTDCLSDKYRGLSNTVVNMNWLSHYCDFWDPICFLDVNSNSYFSQCFGHLKKRKDNLYEYFTPDEQMLFDLSRAHNYINVCKLDLYKPSFLNILRLGELPSDIIKNNTTKKPKIFMDLDLVDKLAEGGFVFSRKGEGDISLAHDFHIFDGADAISDFIKFGAYSGTSLATTELVMAVNLLYVGLKESDETEFDDQGNKKQKRLGVLTSEIKRKTKTPSGEPFASHGISSNTIKGPYVGMQKTAFLEQEYFYMPMSNCKVKNDSISGKNRARTIISFDMIQTMLGQIYYSNLRKCMQDHPITGMFNIGFNKFRGNIDSFMKSLIDPMRGNIHSKSILKEDYYKIQEKMREYIKKEHYHVKNVTYNEDGEIQTIDWHWNHKTKSTPGKGYKQHHVCSRCSNTFLHLEYRKNERVCYSCISGIPYWMMPAGFCLNDETDFDFVSYDHSLFDKVIGNVLESVYGLYHVESFDEDFDVYGISQDQMFKIYCNIVTGFMNAPTLLGRTIWIKPHSKSSGNPATADGNSNDNKLLSNITKLNMFARILMPAYFKDHQTSITESLYGPHMPLFSEEEYSAFNKIFDVLLYTSKVLSDDELKYTSPLYERGLHQKYARMTSNCMLKVFYGAEFTSLYFFSKMSPDGKLTWYARAEPGKILASLLVCCKKDSIERSKKIARLISGVLELTPCLIDNTLPKEWRSIIFKLHDYLVNYLREDGMINVESFKDFIEPGIYDRIALLEVDKFYDINTFFDLWNIPHDAYNHRLVNPSYLPQDYNFSGGPLLQRKRLDACSTCSCQTDITCQECGLNLCNNASASHITKHLTNTDHKKYLFKGSPLSCYKCAQDDVYKLFYFNGVVACDNHKTDTHVELVMQDNVFLLSRKDNEALFDGDNEKLLEMLKMPINELYDNYQYFIRKPKLFKKFVERFIEDELEKKFTLYNKITVNGGTFLSKTRINKFDQTLIDGTEVVLKMNTAGKYVIDIEDGDYTLCVKPFTAPILNVYKRIKDKEITLNTANLITNKVLPIRAMPQVFSEQRNISIIYHSISTQSLTFVVGPCGTGKTTMIMNYIFQLPEQIKILILTPTHDIAHGISESLYNARITNAYRNLSEANTSVPVKFLSRFTRQRKARIVVSTIQSQLTGFTPDVVFVEEASKVHDVNFIDVSINIGYKSLVLIGDPVQLQVRHHIDNIPLSISNLFNYHATKNAIYLVDQWRLSIPISKYINDKFYPEIRFVNHVDALERDPFRVTFVDAKTVAVNKTQYNIEEITVARRIYNYYTTRYEGKKVQVITFYVSMQSELEDCCAKVLDSIQGLTCYITILIMTKCNSHTLDRQRLNVAFSRARQIVHCIIPKSEYTSIVKEYLGINFVEYKNFSDANSLQAKTLTDYHVLSTLGRSIESTPVCDVENYVPGDVIGFDAEGCLYSSNDGQTNAVFAAGYCNIYNNEYVFGKPTMVAKNNVYIEVPVKKCYVCVKLRDSLLPQFYRCSKSNESFGYYFTRKFLSFVRNNVVHRPIIVVFSGAFDKGIISPLCRFGYISCECSNPAVWFVGSVNYCNSCVYNRMIDGMVNPIIVDVQDHRRLSLTKQHDMICKHPHSGSAHYPDFDAALTLCIARKLIHTQHKQVVSNLYDHRNSIIERKFQKEILRTIDTTICNMGCSEGDTTYEHNIYDVNSHVCSMDKLFIHSIYYLNDMSTLATTAVLHVFVQLLYNDSIRQQQYGDEYITTYSRRTWCHKPFDIEIPGFNYKIIELRDTGVVYIRYERINLQAIILDNDLSVKNIEHHDKYDVVIKGYETRVMSRRRTNFKIKYITTVIMTLHNETALSDLPILLLGATGYNDKEPMTDYLSQNGFDVDRVDTRIGVNIEDYYTNKQYDIIICDIYNSDPSYFRHLNRLVRTNLFRGGDVAVKVTSRCNDFESLNELGARFSGVYIMRYSISVKSTEAILFFINYSPVNHEFTEHDLEPQYYGWMHYLFEHNNYDTKSMEFKKLSKFNVCTFKFSKFMINSNAKMRYSRNREKEFYEYKDLLWSLTMSGRGGQRQRGSRGRGAGRGSTQRGNYVEDGVDRQQQKIASTFVLPKTGLALTELKLIGIYPERNQILLSTPGKNTMLLASEQNRGPEYQVGYALKGTVQSPGGEEYHVSGSSYLKKSGVVTYAPFTMTNNRDELTIASTIVQSVDAVHNYVEFKGSVIKNIVRCTTRTGLVGHCSLVSMPGRTNGVRGLLMSNHVAPQNLTNTLVNVGIGDVTVVNDHFGEGVVVTYPGRFGSMVSYDCVTPKPSTTKAYAIRYTPGVDGAADMYSIHEVVVDMATQTFNMASVAGSSGLPLLIKRGSEFAVIGIVQKSNGVSTYFEPWNGQTFSVKGVDADYVNVSAKPLIPFITMLVMASSCKYDYSLEIDYPTGVSATGYITNTYNNTMHYRSEELDYTTKLKPNETLKYKLTGNDVTKLIRSLVIPLTWKISSIEMKKIATQPCKQIADFAKILRSNVTNRLADQLSYSTYNCFGAMSNKSQAAFESCLPYRLDSFSENVIRSKYYSYINNAVVKYTKNSDIDINWKQCTIGRFDDLKISDFYDVFNYYTQFQHLLGSYEGYEKVMYNKWYSIGILESSGVIGNTCPTTTIVDHYTCIVNSVQPYYNYNKIEVAGMQLCYDMRSNKFALPLLDEFPAYPYNITSKSKGYVNMTQHELVAYYYDGKFIDDDFVYIGKQSVIKSVRVVSLNTLNVVLFLELSYFTRMKNYLLQYWVENNNLYLKRYSTGHLTLNGKTCAFIGSYNSKYIKIECPHVKKIDGLLNITSIDCKVLTCSYAFRIVPCYRHICLNTFTEMNNTILYPQPIITSTGTKVLLANKNTKAECTGVLRTTASTKYMCNVGNITFTAPSIHDYSYEISTKYVSLLMPALIYSYRFNSTGVNLIANANMCVYFRNSFSRVEKHCFNNSKYIRLQENGSYSIKIADEIMHFTRVRRSQNNTLGSSFSDMRNQIDSTGKTISIVLYCIAGLSAFVVFSALLMVLYTFTSVVFSCTGICRDVSKKARNKFSIKNCLACGKDDLSCACQTTKLMGGVSDSDEEAVLPKVKNRRFITSCLPCKKTLIVIIMIMPVALCNTIVTADITKSMHKINNDVYVSGNYDVLLNGYVGAVSKLNMEGDSVFTSITIKYSNSSCAYIARQIYYAYDIDYSVKTFADASLKPDIHHARSEDNCYYSQDSRGVNPEDPIDTSCPCGGGTITKPLKLDKWRDNVAYLIKYIMKPKISKRVRCLKIVDRTCQQSFVVTFGSNSTLVTVTEQSKSHKITPSITMQFSPMTILEERFEDMVIDDEGIYTYPFAQYRQAKAGTLGDVAQTSDVNCSKDLYIADDFIQRPPLQSKVVRDCDYNTWTTRREPPHAYHLACENVYIKSFHAKRKVSGYQAFQSDKHRYDINLFSSNGCVYRVKKGIENGLVSYNCSTHGTIITLNLKNLKVMEILDVANLKDMVIIVQKGNSVASGYSQIINVTLISDAIAVVPVYSKNAVVLSSHISLQVGKNNFLLQVYTISENTTTNICIQSLCSTVTLRGLPPTIHTIIGNNISGIYKDYFSAKFSFSGSTSEKGILNLGLFGLIAGGGIAFFIGNSSNLKAGKIAGFSTTIIFVVGAIAVVAILIYKFKSKFLWFL